MQRFEALCHEHRLPITVQRRTILEAVLGRDDHPTADQLYEQVQRRLPGVSRTTVYRVLEMLVRLGIIGKACHPGATVRFDRNTTQHHHLVCLRCGKVIDLQDKRLDNLQLPDTRHHGFVVTEFRVQLRGICGNCGKKATTSKPVPTPRKHGFDVVGKKLKRSPQESSQRR